MQAGSSIVNPSDHGGDGQERHFAPRGAGAIAVLLFAVFFGWAAWPRFMATPGLFWSVLGWGIGLVAAASLLWLRDGGKLPSMELAIRRPHYVQLLIQCGVFAYWGWHWRTVYGEIPLILSQVAFAYLVEFIICWQRHRHWRVGFGPWPIVLSTNLFMWFHDEYFAAQYLMVALAYVSREWLRWKRDGKSVHIFNPSAFGLCVVSLVLILWEIPHLTYGNQISTALARPEFAYEFIFVMGFIVQFLFRVTLVTLSAAATSWVIGALYFSWSGGFMYVDTTIPIAVFLGMNLLVTDPASSPQSNGGKILFGILYGAAIFFMYAVLRDAGRPAVGDDPGLNIAWMDKLLFLPFLNLLARPLDRIGQYLSLARWGWSWDATRTNWVHLSVWLVVFLTMRPGLVTHPGAQVSFWQDACGKLVPRACENVVILNQRDCKKGDAKSCYNLGVHFEHGSTGPQKTVSVDLARAGGAYREACKLGEGAGCRNLGVLFVQGKGVAQNEKAAFTLFEAGCAKGDADACAFVAQAYVSGIGHGADQTLAVKRARKGCRQGSPFGCRILGDSLRLGRGVGKNSSMAVAVLKKGCQGKDQTACTLLGTMVWLGDGTERDSARGLQYIDSACRSGFQQACTQAERLRSRSP